MKVLVIGYGSIGKRHTAILSSISTISEIDVVSKQKNIGYKTFSDLEDIYDLSVYDYFVIASITSIHEKQLNYINDRVNKKIILVEKPISTRVFELDERNQIYVAYNLRFHPIIQRLKKIAQNEKVISINIQTGQYLPSWRPDRDYSQIYSASRSDGGGVLLDLSHEIDYLIWIFGKIESFDAINRKISNLNISSDDFFTSVGFLAAGAVFNITMDYISKIFMRNIIVNTEYKTYTADLLKNELACSDESCLRKVIYSEEVDINHTYLEMHIQAINNNVKKQIATYPDGIAVLAWIDAIRSSNGD